MTSATAEVPPISRGEGGELRGVAADGVDGVARCCEPAGESGADAAGGADDDDGV